jgi:hypothetical protein
MSTMTIFAYGSNFPGCLPENHPEDETTFDEAKRALIAEMLFDADEETTTSDDAEELTAAAEDVNLWGHADLAVSPSHKRFGEWTVTAAGRVYFIHEIVLYPASELALAANGK